MQIQSLRHIILAVIIIALAVSLWMWLDSRGDSQKTASRSMRPVAESTTPPEPVPEPTAAGTTKGIAPTSPDAVDWTTHPITLEDADRLAGALMTPELAKTLLARLKSEMKNIDHRGILSAAIMHALCKNGHSEEAWQLMETGPGSVRIMEIGMLFQSDPEPLDALVGRLAGLEDAEERGQALRALIMGRTAEILNFDFSKIPVTTPKDRIALTSGLMIAMGAAEKSKDPATAEALLQKSLDLAKSGTLDTGNFLTIMKGSQMIDPFQKWKILENLNVGFSPQDVDRLGAEAVPSMIREDMEKAMGILSTDRMSKYSVPILSRAISTMYDSDSERANNWVVTQLPSIDPATGQRVVMMVGQAAIRSGEFDTALQWANRLLNPGVKQQLLDQIKAAQQPVQTK